MSKTRKRRLLAFATVRFASGFNVTMFLVSSGVDWVRKGAADKARLQPPGSPGERHDPDCTGRGGDILVCPPFDRASAATTNRT